MKETMDRMSNAFRGNSPAEKRAHFRKQREMFQVRAALGSFQVQARAQTVNPPRTKIVGLLDWKWKFTFCCILVCDAMFFLVFHIGPEGFKGMV